MFVRVKKIGGYEYLYLVENVCEGDATSSAHLAWWRRQLPGGMPTTFRKVAVKWL
jgi:hypothetical protein